jgi:hypothetical protein
VKDANRFANRDAKLPGEDETRKLILPFQPFGGDF